MDKNSQFKTNRLTIRFAKESDLETIIRWENEPENRDFVWQGTLEEHRMEMVDPEHALQVFVDQTDQSLIGYSLSRWNRQSNWLELRRIVIEQKGQGYGKEVMKGLFQYFFDELGVNKIWLDVYPHNVIGIQLYEGLGMTRDGVLRQNYYSERLGYLDQIIYSLLKSEYEEVRK